MKAVLDAIDRELSSLDAAASALRAARALLAGLPPADAGGDAGDASRAADPGKRPKAQAAAGKAAARKQPRPPSDVALARRRAVLDALKAGPLTKARLLERTGLPEPALRAALRELSSKSSIVRDGDVVKLWEHARHPPGGARPALADRPPRAVA